MSTTRRERRRICDELSEKARQRARRRAREASQPVATDKVPDPRMAFHAAWLIAAVWLTVMAAIITLIFEVQP